MAGPAKQTSDIQFSANEQELHSELLVAMPMLQLVQTIMQRITALAEKSTTELSSRFKQLAEQAETQAKNVEDAIESAKVLTINEKSMAFEEALYALEDMVSDAMEAVQEAGGASDELSESLEGARARINCIVFALGDREADYQKMLHDAAQTHKNTAETMSAMIMEMQFQDRAAQKVHNASALVNEMQETLAAMKVANALSKDDAHIKTYAEQVANHLTLGEFKRDFIQLLVQHNIIESESDVGVITRMGSGAENDDDDVDLF